MKKLLSSLSLLCFVAVFAEEEGQDLSVVRSLILNLWKVIILHLGATMDILVWRMLNIVIDIYSRYSFSSVVMRTCQYFSACSSEASCQRK